ncbi:MAG: phosphoribosylglycinamide formyltransferase [Anaerofustis sp.]
MSVKSVAVLVSGSGTNLQTLIDNIHGIYGRIIAVISDAPDVYALDRAEKANIPTETVNYAAYGDKSLFYEELLNILRQKEPDLIVLAGFMKILPGEFYERFPNKIINIHPALIPAFCGKGYYGIKVHEAVLRYGAKVTGVTVHFADDKADHGPIILQKCVPVLEGDTPEILQQRVLLTEHELLPYAVQLFLQDRLEVDGRTVRILDEK